MASARIIAPEKIPEPGTTERKIRISTAQSSIQDHLPMVDKMGEGLTRTLAGDSK